VFPYPRTQDKVILGEQVSIGLDELRANPLDSPQAIKHKSTGFVHLHYVSEAFKPVNWDTKSLHGDEAACNYSCGIDAPRISTYRACGWDRDLVLGVTIGMYSTFPNMT
jgi:hypothetical protein